MILAAFEDNNNFVVPPLNEIGSGLRLGKRLVWLCPHKNTLTIAILIPVNKGRGTAEHNTSFNHSVILLTTLYEYADHMYHTDSHESCDRTAENRA